MTSFVHPTTQDRLDRQDAQSIRDAVRQAVRESRAAVEEARALDQEAVLASPLSQQSTTAAIDLLRAEIAGAKKEITDLTSQLSNGVTDAREAAIQAQIESGSDRLESLQERLDRLITGEPVERVVVGPAAFPADIIPPQAVDITMAFFMTVAVIAIGIPLARGISRWLERRGQPAAADMTPRLDRIEQAVDAVAIEVERISEGQRFANRLMGEMRALPGANALADWPVAAREALPIERRDQGK